MAHFRLVRETTRQTTTSFLQSCCVWTKSCATLKPWLETTIGWNLCWGIESFRWVSELWYVAWILQPSTVPPKPLSLLSGVPRSAKHYPQKIQHVYRGHNSCYSGCIPHVFGCSAMSDDITPDLCLTLKIGEAPDLLIIFISDTPAIRVQPSHVAKSPCRF